MLTLFYVSNNVSEWEKEREDLKSGKSYAYMLSRVYGVEFNGYVGFDIVNGGIVRNI